MNLMHVMNRPAGYPPTRARVSDQPGKWFTSFISFIYRALCCLFSTVPRGARS